jgi:hypothetical protein
MVIDARPSFSLSAMKLECGNLAFDDSSEHGFYFKTDAQHVIQFRVSSKMELDAWMFAVNHNHSYAPPFPLHPLFTLIICENPTLIFFLMLAACSVSCKITLALPVFGASHSTCKVTLTCFRRFPSYLLGQSNA